MTPADPPSPPKVEFPTFFNPSLICSSHTNIQGSQSRNIYIETAGFQLSVSSWLKIDEAQNWKRI